ncbi:uncharacterized protein C05D11.13-like [Centruroides vittatus]|uniref:uncharacterized protein C05D11.13-like n=1 Tax=Centruroides vittatus TaxID=120091 RepID=UPI00350FADA4
MLSRKSNICDMNKKVKKEIGVESENEEVDENQTHDDIKNKSEIKDCEPISAGNQHIQKEICNIHRVENEEYILPDDNIQERELDGENKSMENSKTEDTIKNRKESNYSSNSENTNDMEDKITSERIPLEMEVYNGDECLEEFHNADKIIRITQKRERRWSKERRQRWLDKVNQETLEKLKELKAEQMRLKQLDETSKDIELERKILLDSVRYQQSLNEDPVQRKRRLAKERRRRWLAKQSQESLQNLKRVQAERKRLKRLNETPEEKAIRRKKDAERHREIRQNNLLNRQNLHEEPIKKRRKSSRRRR